MSLTSGIVNYIHFVFYYCTPDGCSVGGCNVLGGSREIDRREASLQGEKRRNRTGKMKR